MVPPPSANQNQQNPDVQRHCILLAASNPYLLPTPVYRPQMPNPEPGDNIEVQPLGRLADAVEVAKCFSYVCNIYQLAIAFNLLQTAVLADYFFIFSLSLQCPVTLSVISPKQIPKLKEIYNAVNNAISVLSFSIWSPTWILVDTDSCNSSVMSK